MLKNVQCAAASQKDLDEWMQDRGVNTFLSAVALMPHFSIFTGCPQDMMHIWCEGVARQGLGALSYWLKTVCRADLNQIPSLIAKVCKERGFPRTIFNYFK